MSWLKEMLSSPLNLSKEGALEKAIERACSLPQEYEVDRLFLEAQSVLPEIHHQDDHRGYFILTCLDKLLDEKAIDKLTREHKRLTIDVLATAARADRGWPSDELTKWVKRLGRTFVIDHMPDLFANMPAKGDRNLLSLTVSLNDETCLSDLVGHMQNTPQKLRDLALLVWGAARTSHVAALVGSLESIKIDERAKERAESFDEALKYTYEAANGCMDAFVKAMDLWAKLSQEKLLKTYKVTDGDYKDTDYEATTKQGTTVDFLTRAIAGLIHYVSEPTYRLFVRRLRDKNLGSRTVSVIERRDGKVEQTVYTSIDILERMRSGEPLIDLSAPTELIKATD